MKISTFFRKAIQFVFIVPAIPLSIAACATESESSIPSDEGALNTPSRAQPIWLVATPTQCNTNFWEGPGQVEPAEPHLAGELGVIHAYLRAKGIAVSALGLLDRPPSDAPAISCAACQCPRGDRLLVRAKTQTDADALMRQYQFEPVGDAVLARGSISCNANPWDPNRQTRGSSEDLGRWLTDQQAPVTFAGFVEPVVRSASCRACTCARGDQAVVIADDETSREALVSLKFEPVAQAR